jgi:hypothetical protein
VRIVGNIAARVVPRTQFVFATQLNGTPQQNVYPFESTGFGTRFANPASQSSGGIADVAVASNNDAVIYSRGSSPYQDAYPLTSTAYGTRFSNPADGLSFTSPLAVSLNASNSVVSFGGVVASSPPFSAWEFSTSTGYGTKYTNYTYTSTVGQDVLDSDWRPQGDSWLAAMQGTTNKVAVFKWSSGWVDDTRKSPATQPSGQISSTRWSKDGNVVGVAHLGSPFVTAFPWDQTTYFGTKFSDPATLPTGVSTGVSFNVSDNAIVVSHENSPFITAYAFSTSTGFGTKYADPTSLPSCSTYAQLVVFSKLGTEVFVLLDQSPYIQAYSWDTASGFGTRFSNPATLPTNLCVGLAVN